MDYEITLVDRNEGLEYRDDTGVYSFNVALKGKEWTVYIPGLKGEDYYELSPSETKSILPRITSFLENIRWFLLFGGPYSVRFIRQEPKDKDAIIAEQVAEFTKKGWIAKRNPDGSVLVSPPKKRYAIFWLVLGLVFVAQTVYQLYIYVYVPFPPSESVISMLTGLAVLGLPMGLLCISFYLLRKWQPPPVVTRIGVFVCVVVGLVSLLGGLNILWPPLPYYANFRVDSLMLHLVAFVLFPLFAVIVPIYFVRRLDVVENSSLQTVQFWVCVALHVLQVFFWLVWPFSAVFRFGAATLACFFAAGNLHRLDSTNTS